MATARYDFERYLNVRTAYGASFSPNGKRLRVQPNTVRRHLETGQLRGFKLGRRSGWRIQREDMERFISIRFNTATPGEVE